MDDHEFFVISGIIKGEVRARLITLTEILIIPHIKTKNSFCVRGTRIALGILCIIGCPVQLIREVFWRLHFRGRHTFASL